MTDSKIRVELTGGYTVLQNEALRDPRLTFKARGLLGYMLSLPPEWNFSVSGLSRLNKDGKDSIRSALKELEAAGYLTREGQGRDDGGQFTGGNYVLHDVSVLPDGTVAENPPRSEPTASGFPTTENPTERNKDQVNKYINTPLPPKGGSPAAKEDKLKLDDETRKLLNTYVGRDRELACELTALLLIRQDDRKARNNQRGIGRLLSRLDRLSGGDRAIKVQLVRDAADAGWTTVWPPRSGSGSAPERRREEVDDW